MKKWPVFLLVLFNLSITSPAGDNITMETSISDGQTLISAGGIFELGFFTPGTPENKYLGIWYMKIPETIVWVANRGNPITNSTCNLTIGNGGGLVLQNNEGNTIWSTPLSNLTRLVAQLLDSGNFVLKDVSNDSESSIVWQSFDYPSDTLLAGMKLGWNRETNLNRYLTTWKSSNDPSEGDYSFKMDLQGSPEFYIWDQLKKFYRNGPWVGYGFSGEPEMKNNNAFSFDFVSNEDEVYYMYKILDSSIISRFVLNQSMIQRYVWMDSQGYWFLYWSLPRDQCDYYAQCGPYGVCNSNKSPVCDCLQGFEPKSPQEWNLNDALSGCVRRTPLQCQDRDGFLKVSGMKLPDTSQATVDESIDLDECRLRCLRNCSCMAYSSANYSAGESGCITWEVDLIDLREFVDNGQDLYLRLAASELGNSKKKHVIIVIVMVAFVTLLLLGFIGCFILKRKHRRTASHGPDYFRRRQLQLSSDSFSMNYFSEDENRRGKELELPLFDLSTVALSTDNFSDANKLGEGGFGSVYKLEISFYEAIFNLSSQTSIFTQDPAEAGIGYKMLKSSILIANCDIDEMKQGILQGEQLIAVKRLSKTSSQGLEEFKNEVMLIVKLQHVNLVHLLGCCIEGEERMLIYEYMDNRSLDTIVFDNTKSNLLSWQKRFNIIVGIARGLLYLHQDSRFRIIHRDLKASNILLDKDMTPKISDFGLARTFGGDGKDEHTRRLVGTYGYMAPEYAMDGIFSIKSDVFSFGVLVLEIISGKKNKGTYYTGPEQNVISYAWSLWKEGNTLQLLDDSISCSDYHPEVLRCIQVGLLCVQERAEDRPEMSQVLLMLSAEVVLPKPKSPGFSAIRSPNPDGESSSNYTVNDITVTAIEGR